MVIFIKKGYIILFIFIIILIRILYLCIYKKTYYKDLLNSIKSWDKNIIDEVKLEYERVNYVTISTVMIDRIINKYQKNIFRG